MAGRIPPHSIGAESHVLGAVMSKPGEYSVAAAIVGADDFYRPRHVAIWAAVAALDDSGIEVNITTVADRLARTGQLDDVGGSDYLTDLVADCPTLTALSPARIVAEMSVLRRMIGIASEIVEASYDLPEDVDDFVNWAEQQLYLVGDHTLRRSGEMVSLGQALDELSAEYAKRDAGQLGFNTGFRDLDFMIGGFMPGRLYVLGGRTSMGKTATALKMSTTVALSEPVLIYSLEMARTEVAHRIHAGPGGIDTRSTLQPNWGNKKWERVSKSMVDAKGKYNISICEEEVSVAEMRAGARRLARHKKRPLGLIVVDFLQLATPVKHRENKNVEVSEISRGLKLMARELHVPIVAVSQHNRNYSHRNDKRPMLGDLRDSGAIEQDADVVLGVYRPSVDDRTARVDVDAAELHVLKNRHGPTGIVEMIWHPSLSWFVPRWDPAEL